MYRIALNEARIGMVLAESIISDDGKNLLLNAGQVLNQDIILKLQARNILFISVDDIHSLQINPIDQMSVTLKRSFYHVISKYSSMQQVGNKRDDIPQIVKKMYQVIESICNARIILDYCLQMQMVKEGNLYEKSH